MNRLLIIVFSMFICTFAIAQKITLNARVVDANTGEVLPYVNVYAMTSQVGTITNHDGDFTLEAEPDEVIRIEFVGYETKRLKANTIKKEVRLDAWTLNLQEVQVMGWEHVLLAISKDLKKQMKTRTSKESTYFMRMLTTCTNKEQVEAFAVANSACNLRNLTVKKGRHSRKSDETSNPLLGQMNLHYYLQMGPWMEGFGANIKSIRPLQPDLKIETLQKNYLIKGETLEDTSGKKYYRLTLNKRPEVKTSIVTGTLYVDASTRKMMRFEGRVENSVLSTELFGVRNEAPSVVKIHINYNNAKGYTQVADVATFVSSGEVRNQSVLFCVDDMKLKFDVNEFSHYSSHKDNILSAVQYAGYDEELWENSNIVKRTDEEEKVLTLSNQNTMANNTPLLDVPISGKEWAFIGSLSKDADKRLVDMVTRLARFTRSYPQEKVYVHMDNTNYFVGDTIWFTAYTRSTKDDLPSRISNTLYVELLNQDGYLVERKLIAMNNGRGFGHFALKGDYYSGFYELRAYTRWQLNWGYYEREDKGLGTDCFLDEELRSYYYRDYDKLYSRVFPVYDAHKSLGDKTKEMTLRPLQGDDAEFHRELTLTLYPEGGNLVAGIPSRVAYEAVWSDGELAQLVDRQSRGIIDVTPTLGEEQEITFCDINNNKVSAVLPKPETEGVVMKESQTEDEWHIDLQFSSNIKTKDVAVSLMRQGMLYKVFDVRNSHDVIKVKKADLPEGVYQATVFDVEGRVLADRLFFNTVKDDYVPVTFVLNDTIKSPEQAVIDAYAPIKLTVTGAPDATISVSVRDAENNDRLNDNASLRTEMLLSSEIKGFIANPQYYFESDDEEHRQALDLLMMIQGWRRFDWQSMVIPNETKFVQYAEQNPLVQGRIYHNPELGRDKMNLPIPDMRMRAYQLLDGEEGTHSDFLSIENTFAFKLGNVPNRERVELIISAADMTGWSTNKQYSYNWAQIMPIPLLPGEEGKVEYVEPAQYLARLQMPYPRFVKPYNFYQQRFIDGNKPVVHRATNMGFSDTAPALVVEAKDAWNHALDAGMWSSSFEDIVKSYLGTSADTTLQHRNIEVRYGRQKAGVGKFYLEHPLEDVYKRAEFSSFLHRDKNGEVKFHSESDATALYEMPNSHEMYMIYTDFQPRKAVDCNYSSSPSDTQFAVYRKYFDARESLFRDRDIMYPFYSRQATFYRQDYKNRKLDEAPKDYRRTLYWNPALKLDSTGRINIRLYNNCTSGHISISAEGMTDEGTILEY